MDAPTPVVAGVMLAFAGTLMIYAMWDQPRIEKRRQEYVNRRVREAVASLPDAVKRQPAERGMTVGEWLLRQVVASGQRQRKAGADPDPDARFRRTGAFADLSRQRIAIYPPRSDCSRPICLHRTARAPTRAN